MPSSIVRKAVVPVAALVRPFFLKQRRCPRPCCLLSIFPPSSLSLKKSPKAASRKSSSSAATPNAPSRTTLIPLRNWRTSSSSPVRPPFWKKSAISPSEFHYIRQKQQRGLGDAILCAKDFIDGEPFIVALPDDIILNDEEKGLSQLLRQFETTRSTILGCCEVRAGDVSKYGIISGETDETHPDLVRVHDIMEKPVAENAPSHQPSLGAISLRLTSLITWNSRQTALTDRSS